MENDKYLNIRPTFNRNNPHNTEMITKERLWQWVDSFHQRTGFKDGIERSEREKNRNDF
jgi:hypothetical protein